MRTGLKSDPFSFKFFIIVQFFFCHFCFCAFLSISANLEFISINFIAFKVFHPNLKYVPGVKGLLSVGLISTVIHTVTKGQILRTSLY